MKRVQFFRYGGPKNYHRIADFVAAANPQNLQRLQAEVLRVAH